MSFIEHNFDLLHDGEKDWVNLSKDAETPGPLGEEKPLPLIEMDYDHYLGDMTCGKDFPPFTPEGASQTDSDTAAQTYTSAGIRAES